MHLTEVGCEVVDWIRLAQDRVHWRAHVNTVMNLWVPLNVGYFLTRQLSLCREGLFKMCYLIRGLIMCMVRERTGMDLPDPDWSILTDCFNHGDRFSASDISIEQLCNCNMLRLQIYESVACVQRRPHSCTL
jgi:hypothetical protein